MYMKPYSTPDTKKPCHLQWISMDHHHFAVKLAKSTRFQHPDLTAKMEQHQVIMHLIRTRQFFFHFFTLLFK